MFDKFQIKSNDVIEVCSIIVQNEPVCLGWFEVSYFIANIEHHI